MRHESSDVRSRGASAGLPVEAPLVLVPVLLAFVTNQSRTEVIRLNPSRQVVISTADQAQIDRCAEASQCESRSRLANPKPVHCNDGRLA